MEYYEKEFREMDLSNIRADKALCISVIREEYFKMKQQILNMRCCENCELGKGDPDERCDECKSYSNWILKK